MKAYRKPARQWKLHAGSIGPGGERRMELVAQRAAGLVRAEPMTPYVAAVASALCEWRIACGSVQAGLIYAQTVERRARAINRERATRATRAVKAFPNLPTPKVMPWERTDRVQTESQSTWERSYRDRVLLEPSSRPLGRVPSTV